MNLVAAMRGQYRRSETLLWAGISVKAVVYLSTLAAAIWSSHLAAVVFLTVVCVGQGSLLLIRSSSQGHLGVAQRLRRLAMLEDGLGKEVPKLEEAILAEKIWDTPSSPISEQYYSSRLSKGPARLIDITSECAFFSGSISNAAWRTFLTASITASCLLLLSLVLLTLFGVGQTRLEVVAKAALIGITFWTTEDLMEMALRYREAGNSCDRILQECSQALDSGISSAEDAYTLFHEYDAAVSNLPPLPTRIYRKRNSRLSKIWSEAHPRTIGVASN
jgi:hypothetical protein